jgi:hypothetical protein
MIFMRNAIINYDFNREDEWHSSTILIGNVMTINYVFNTETDNKQILIGNMTLNYDCKRLSRINLSRDHSD